MRVVFMGTPDFAVPCLARLAEMDAVEIAGVVTQPDKPRGRGQKLLPPPVKAWATEHDLPVYQPAKIKAAEFVAVLRGLAPDLIVVVAFGQILSPEILALPPLGCINVHASLLPRYRGAAPMQWCLLNGEKETGVTTMFMDEGLDTGDMLLKQAVPVPEDMALPELHDTLRQAGADLLAATLAELKAGKLNRIPQDAGLATYAPLLKKEHGHIAWHKSAREIHNQVRALATWPGAYTYLDGQKIKLWRTEVLAEPAKAAPGEIVAAEKNRLCVATGDGLLAITELQAPGGKRLSAAAYMNGHGLKLPSCFGG